MKPVFKHASSSHLGYMQSVLEDAGIQTYLQNEYSHNVLTAVPIDLFRPALCVINDDDYEKALTIIKDLHRAPSPAEPIWTCPRCSETVPGNFDLCWKCGAGQP